MAQNSKIQWTESTWNPWHGCKKVSTGCRGCYMFRAKERWGQDPTIVERSKTKFKEPLKWKEPQLIFTCSWSDFFIEEADEWRPEAWEIIRDTPQHTYQILTKRPERILQHLPPDWGQGYDHVQLLVSGENEALVYSRLSTLLQVPAKVRGLSAEPLLAPIHTARVADLIAQLDWVIVGGESGNLTGKYRFRECQLEWIRHLIRICRERNVPVFVKQLGSHLYRKLKLKDWHGGDTEEWPEDLRVLEMPVKKESKYFQVKPEFKMYTSVPK